MVKQLRLLAGEIVIESDMSKASKLQLLNFIKEEATDAQIKALLMDGKIIKLDEQAEEIVNDRFKQHKLNEFEGATGVTLVSYVVTMIVAMAFAAVKRSRERGHDVCDRYFGNEKANCIKKYRKHGLEEKLKILNSMSSKCDGTRNPDKCHKLIDTQIDTTKRQLEDLN